MYLKLTYLSDFIAHIKRVFESDLYYRAHCTHSVNSGQRMYLKLAFMSDFRAQTERVFESHLESHLHYRAQGTHSACIQVSPLLESEEHIQLVFASRLY